MSARRKKNNHPVDKPANDFHKKPTKKPGFLRRTAMSLTLAFGAAVGLGGAAMAQELETRAPDTRGNVTFVEPARAQLPEVQDQDQVYNIQELKDEFNRTAMGRDLMKFADDHKIKIIYDKEVANIGALATYSSWESTARVNPTLPMEEQVLFLAHELRHAWQDKVLGCAEMEATLVSPEERWTLRRFEEADAAAWSSYFWAERMIELNTQSFVPVNSFQEFLFAVKIRHEIEKTDDGLTLDEYRDIVAKQSFEDLNYGYNSSHLRLAGYQFSKMYNAFLGISTLVDDYEYDKADAALADLRERLDEAPTRPELEKHLRQYFGTSLDTKDATSLQSDKVSQEDIFENFPVATDFFSPWLPADQRPQTARTLQIFEDAFQDLKMEIDSLEQINNANRELYKGKKPPPPPVTPVVEEKADAKTKIAGKKPPPPRVI